MEESGPGLSPIIETRNSENCVDCFDVCGETLRFQLRVDQGDGTP